MKNNENSFPLWLCILGLGVLFLFLKVWLSTSYQTIFKATISGLGITLWVSLLAYSGSIVLGFIIGLCRCSPSYVLRQLAILYVETLRGIPMLVILLFVAYVGAPVFVSLLNGLYLPRLLRPDTSPYTLRDISYVSRTIIALIIGYSAYVAEIVRAGIQSVPQGQQKAAQALGMSRLQVMFLIVLPQAFRNTLPALVNELLAMIKDSALVSFLGVRDITLSAKLYASSTFLYMESYSIAALIYLLITLSLSCIVRFMERDSPHRLKFL